MSGTKQAIPIDALLIAFYEIDLAKAANELVYSRGKPVIVGRCEVCEESFQSHTNGKGGPLLGCACLDCTTGDPFR